jgi:chaperonin GroEL
MLINQNQSIEKVIEGISKGADIITSTLGGAGKNVLMFKDGGLAFTKDGVSVAREIGFPDVENNIGAQLLIDAANKTVKHCGDGTTLTSLFVKEFVEKLFKEIRENGAEVNDLLDNTRLLIADVSNYLKTQARQIESTQDVYNIAFTSCKNAKLATLIQNVYKKSGLDARITLNKSTEHRETYVEHTEGLTMYEGMINSYFANQDDGSCVFEKPEVWIEDKYFNLVDDIKGQLEDSHTKKVPLVIIGRNFSQAVIQHCLRNKVGHQNLQVCLIKLPGFGTQAVKENIADMKVFLTDGTCNRIHITEETFTIYNNPAKQSMRKRLVTLNLKAERSTEEFDQRDYFTRIANLQQKSAIIHVGGITEKSRDEEYDRIEDAIGAVKSATIMGYVPGTGVTLYNYAQDNYSVLPDYFYHILKEPAYKILSNANLSNLEPADKPFNVRIKQIDETLIDPVYVIITALENSFALAELLVNTSYVMHD